MNAIFPKWILDINGYWEDGTDHNRKDFSSSVCSSWRQPMTCI